MLKSSSLCLYTFPWCVTACIDQTECYISGSYQSLTYSPWCVTACIDKTECCISGSYQSLTYSPWCVTACIDRIECCISGSYQSLTYSPWCVTACIDKTECYTEKLFRPQAQILFCWPKKKISNFSNLGVSFCALFFFHCFFFIISNTIYPSSHTHCGYISFRSSVILLLPLFHGLSGKVNILHVLCCLTSSLTCFNNLRISLVRNNLQYESGHF